MTIRDATASDAAAVQAIYAPYVLASHATFEEIPPSVADTQYRRKAVATGVPYLVAVVDGSITGYAYATPYRPRAAYRYTVEDSGVRDCWLAETRCRNSSAGGTDCGGRRLPADDRRDRR